MQQFPPEAHMHDNVIDFEKNLKNAWPLLKFLKIKLFKSFPLYSSLATFLHISKFAWPIAIEYDYE